MSNWLPIESAPKDGALIDLWFECSGRITDCEFKNNSWGREEWRGNHTVWLRFGAAPTHWMSIPNPPK